ncbi:MAG: fasciclin domain-containing protein [Methanomicrobiales archaeon]|nr:fasciclin domain-containing protein [Methanomicrobiales archaeon]
MKNIVETAREAGSFATLIRAVEAAGLTDVFSGHEPYTVCAPNDAAFKALPAGTLDKLLKDKAALANVLKLHVVAGRHRASEVRTLRTIKTLQGGELPVTIRGKDLMIGDARVIKPDIEASNGYIHVIDRVLMPR